jgi:hypothetical protein
MWPARSDLSTSIEPAARPPDRLPALGKFAALCVSSTCVPSTAIPPPGCSSARGFCSSREHDAQHFEIAVHRLNAKL